MSISKLVKSTELKFISDRDLEQHVSTLIKKYLKATDSAEEKLHSNVIDPFSATMDAMCQNITLDDWLKQERSRQIQKSLQNYVGEFHENLIGSINDWEKMEVGGNIDLKNRTKKIIAEVKNKHNTMNSGSQLDVYDKLQKHLDYGGNYAGYVAYCVTIIPRSSAPFNKAYNPSERGTRRPKRDDIRIIDGRSFYQIATGDVEALQKIYYRLPVIIGRVLDVDYEDFISSNLFGKLFNKVYKND